MNRTVADAIAKQIHQLSVAIDAERAERVQAVADVQGQIAELRDEFRVFISNPNQRPRDDLRTDARTDEVVIGGFDLKSKEGLIRIVEKVIAGNDGNSKKIEDRMSTVSKVISMEFNSRSHVEVFVRRHAGKCSVFCNKY